MTPIRPIPSTATFRPEPVGWISAAHPRTALERFDEELLRRGEIGDRYNRLMDQAGIARVRQKLDRGSVFAQYTVFVDQRDRVRKALQQAGIPVAVHYPLPLNEQPAYRDLCCPDGTPVAKATAQRVLSVPMGADRRPEQQARVVEALHAAVHGGTELTWTTTTPPGKTP